MSFCLRFSVAVTLLYWSTQAAWCQPKPGPTQRPDDSIAVKDDGETLVRSIRIDAPQGKVKWEDVFRVVARLQGYSDKDLENALPKGTLDLNKRFVSQTMLGLNLAFAPHVAFQVAKDGQSQPQLIVTIDRASMQRFRRDIKKDIRSKVKKWPLTKPQAYGLFLDRNWRSRKRDLPLVVAIHGYNSNPLEAGELLDIPRANGLPCGVFHYPNDQPIEESAKLLSLELKALGKSDPQRDVAIVAHSMGGVVSRAVIEDHQLDPGNVTRLIMISPPNHGSQLARFAVATDVWEFLDRLVDDQMVRSVSAAVQDGLGEASVDLEPGSLFLTKLNRRARNPQVDYSILTGTAAPISAREMDRACQQLERAGNRNQWLKFMVSKLDRILSDLDEVVDGRGDGVVASKRARLDGVHDFVAMRFSHNQPIAEKRGNNAEQVHREIFKRLSD